MYSWKVRVVVYWGGGGECWGGDGGIIYAIDQHNSHIMNSNIYSL